MTRVDIDAPNVLALFYMRDEADAFPHR